MQLKVTVAARIGTTTKCDVRCNRANRLPALVRFVVKKRAHFRFPFRGGSI
jgi:hypothetical protein